MNRKPVPLAALLCLSGLLWPGAAVAGTPGVTDLFFSEYIEGTSNNKALELFNGTGAPINLTAGGYNVQMFFNGSGSAGLTINLTGTVADCDVFVLAQSSASAAILAQADQTNGAGWFNGDDAVVLRKGTTIIDVIGQIGFDPGTEWGTGLTSTMDNTLRRKAGVLSGDPNGGDAFDPPIEWDGFATDNFLGLGTHTLTTPCEAAPAVQSTSPGSGASDVALNANVVINFSEAVNVSGAWFGIVCASSGSHTATVSGGPLSFTLDPDSDFAPSESCTATVFASQVTDQDADDPPDNMAADFTWTFTTLLPVRPIYEIQGSGTTSPFVGTQQKTTGVVTVILSNGFFMQDPLGDGNPNSSDGIFVFTGNALARTLTPSDLVTVTGTVAEFRPASRSRDLTLTELSSVTVVKTGTGALPSPVSINDRPDTVIDPDGVDAFERVEGMLVKVDHPAVVGPTSDFGEIVVVAAGDVVNTTPNGNIVVEPLGAGAVDYNPERIFIDDEARVPGGTGAGTRINSPPPQVRVGDHATGDIVGALDYQFSNYRVQANHAISGVLAGTMPSSPIASLRTPEPFEGRIATFNVENLFDCVDAPSKDDDPSCSPADLMALEVKLTKLAAAFEQELGSPEIVIVEEAENTAVLKGDASGNVPGTTIPALLPRIGGNYDAVSFDASDSRGIEVAFVFNTDRVALHDAFLSTDILPDTLGLFDGSGDFFPGREPLVGLFTLDGLDLIVVGNHLKSKGGPFFTGDPNDAGDDPLYGAFQPPTRFTEGHRHQQADYVRALVDLMLVSNPGANAVVGGDLNDFAFAEPGEGTDTVARIKTSLTAPLTNVVDQVPADQRYTFVFEGNSQVLDHILLSDGMAARLTDQGIAHFNADFPSSLGGNPSVTFQASDHDPLVAYFCTDTTPPSLEVSVAPSVLWPPNHKLKTVRATVSASDGTDPDPVLTLVSVTSNEPDNGTGDGDTPNDILIVDDFTFKLRAERAGSGSGRIYTITYQLTDTCGNTTTASATVTVPHSQGW